MTKNSFVAEVTVKLPLTDLGCYDTKVRMKTNASTV